MTIDNKENLIINIDGKTKIFSKEEVKKALSFSKIIEQGEGKILNVFLEKENFCAKYNREQEEKPLTKIYLAIPYSGMEESSYTQATEATMIIINNLGHNVFSPITHSHPIAKLGVKGTWDYWQKIDYQFIDWADEVWVLIPNEGLSKVIVSTGVVAECKYAQQHNKKIRYLTISQGEIKFL